MLPTLPYRCRAAAPLLSGLVAPGLAGPQSRLPHAPFLRRSDRVVAGRHVPRPANTGERRVGWFVRGQRQCPTPLCPSRPAARAGTGRGRSGRARAGFGQIKGPGPSAHPLSTWPWPDAPPARSCCSSTWRRCSSMRASAPRSPQGATRTRTCSRRPGPCCLPRAACVLPPARR